MAMTGKFKINKGGSTLKYRVVMAQLLVAGMLLAGCAPKATAVPVAPDFALTDTYGTRHTLSNYRGQYVVLEWKNHLCPFVRKHYGSGNMQQLQREAAEKGIIWLSIISSAPGEQGYVSAEESNHITEQEKSAAAAVLLDPAGEVGRLYGAKTTPHMFIIDPEGHLIYEGGIDDKATTNLEDIKTARNYIKEAFALIEQGEKLKVTKTTPYGCSVKYKE